MKDYGGDYNQKRLNPPCLRSSAEQVSDWIKYNTPIFYKGCRLVFGKIDYLNLLPFHVFMKRYSRSTRHHLTMQYKKGVPSKINTDFRNRRVDAAFVSSITARGYRHASIGIVAKKEVLSVLVLPGESKADSESATSNVLARILNINGEVVIGDKALRHYLSGKEHIDLAEVWNERYRLPFVFALLCHHSHHGAMERLAKNFTRQKVKIPGYILAQASRRSGIDQKTILEYLEYISYKVGTKAKKGLKKFWRLSAHPH